MKDLIEYIVKQIVNNPDAVVVEEIEDNGLTNFTLSVDPADMGIVIGKAGQTIKAIRKILLIRAMAENKRVNLQILEPENSTKSESSEKTEAVVEETTGQPETSGEEPQDEIIESKEN